MRNNSVNGSFPECLPVKQFESGIKADEKMKFRILV
jgi:hypothetical protein